jgi:MscS family membrane protein
VAYWQWLLLGALIFVGLVLRQLARIGAFVIKRLTARTAATWDDELVDSLTGPATHLATTGVWFASLHLIGITGVAYAVIAFLIKGAFFVNLGYLAYKLAGFVGMLIERRMRERHEDINQSLFNLLRQTMQLLALLFCLLLGAQNMGMDVASLIAGLGIGGLAFALAAKDTLANLFGSVMIMLDRPFRVGDYIVAKGVEGTVEEIGFRSTRIRSAYNSLVSIPNSELVISNVDNLGMRSHRRVRETYGLVYGTPPERVTAFCEGVRAILLARPAVKQDAVTVAFTNLGTSALEVLVNYHLSAPSWDAELAERQAVLLAVIRLADSLQVAFAFPTQTLIIENPPARLAKPLDPGACSAV